MAFQARDCNNSSMLIDHDFAGNARDIRQSTRNFHRTCCTPLLGNVTYDRNSCRTLQQFLARTSTVLPAYGLSVV